MINDAEKFAEEDAALKGKVEARNELESYAYSLKNQLSDKEKLGGKLFDDEQSKIEDVINVKIAWLEENQDASAEDLKAQKKVTNSKMNCSCDIFEHFKSPAPCVAESDI